MRWILFVFAAVVAGLCLLCGEPGTARARRVPVDVVDRQPAPRASAPDRIAPVETEDPEDPEEEPEPAPDDPIVEGDCSLLLSLTSRDTGAPVESRVSLFRLGAPGNEYWTAGDQLQVDVTVPEEGLWIHRLPEGDYRMRAAAQRHPSDDPVRFQMRGPVTEKSFAIPMPRRFHACLIVVDERDRVLRKARRRDVSRSSVSSWARIPWLRERKLRHSDRYVYNSSIGWSCGTPGTYRSRSVEAGANGFDLGQFTERARWGTDYWSSSWEVPGRTEVRLSQSSEPGRDQVWMAISVEPRRIEESILLPGGRAATLARVSIHAKPVLAPSPCPVEFWRTLEVNVKVTLDGYEKMSFVVNPSDPLPLRLRYLRPVPAPAEG